MGTRATTASSLQNHNIRFVGILAGKGSRSTSKNILNFI